MPDTPHLRPATQAEIAETLSFALRYEGRKRRVHDADHAMARITAERLVRHLERAGFVLMRRPPGGGRADIIGDAVAGSGIRAN